MLSRHLTPFAFAALVLVAACGTEQGEQAESAESAAGSAGTPAQATAEGQGAIVNPHEGMAMPGQSGVTRISYACADGKTLQLALHGETGHADLVMGDATVSLAPTPGASGMMFTDGTWTFHGKGTEAFVQKGEEMIYSDCKASGHP
jgi:membrane-bound inhibitor of C-type lysozyme